MIQAEKGNIWERDFHSVLNLCPLNNPMFSQDKLSSIKCEWRLRVEEDSGSEETRKERRGLSQEAAPVRSVCSTLRRQLWPAFSLRHHRLLAEKALQNARAIVAIDTCIKRKEPGTSPLSGGPLTLSLLLLSLQTYPPREASTNDE